MTHTKLFITGGSGYLGRNLIRHFVAKGRPVVALARSDAAVATVTALGATPWRGDLLSPDLADAMADCAELIHAAADTDHGRATVAQLAANRDGTENVFAAAQQAGLNRAVHISTESVLLTGRPLVNATEEQPIPRRAVGGYSRSKAEAERLALSFNGDGFAVVAVRPRMVWGRDDTTAMPQLLGAARSGQLAWIDGGHYRTSSTHIANLCAGVELALAKGRGGEVYFLNDGEAWEFRKLVSAMLAAKGVAVPDKTVPRWLLRSMAMVGDRLAALTNGRVTLPITLQAFATSAVEVTLDISKARQELGYRPVMTIEAGLAEMAQEN
ncbi:Nucleoside-diphosphate-sugar epimerase [Devosia sp. YR412]|uniref:NAD-dependent epimerase/dehydratase family protein n=1 Tax=Devosia sp. YR412 TaxID=1881030 RepID=UPI0008BA3420|nr:NAD-dependent epimerase/dehydratase family protein [Devosia sp. YR412]SEP96842.1 Nucleoside-diphosphate-sugar epimerase [Devosia sp. YR412]